MSGTSDIKFFGALPSSGGGNRLSPAAWAALTSLLSTGFSSGLAPSSQVNTVLSQSSFMAAGFALWCSEQGSINIVDDGNITNLVTAIDAAIYARIIAAGIGGGAGGNVVGPAGSVTAGYFALFDGTTGQLLKEAAGGPGTAAYLNVGTGNNNIVQLSASAKMPAVDGSALTALNATNIASGTLNASRMGSGTPSGSTILYGDNVWRASTLPTVTGSKIVMGAVTIQFGVANCSTSGTTNVFGTAFSGAPYAVLATAMPSVGQPGSVSVTAHSSTGFELTSYTPPGFTPHLTQAYFIAIGPT